MAEDTHRDVLTESLELIDGFTEGSWIVDRTAGTIRCSEKWAARIGLDLVPEREQLGYTHTLVHPDDRRNGNSIEHCMETGLTRFDLEYRVKTTDSGYIWTQNKGKIIYDDEGRAVRVYAATIDITGRKRAEEALRESEARQAFLLELSDAIRPLSDAGLIKNTAARLLAEHLGASQSSYTEFEGDQGVVRDEISYDALSMAGTYDLNDYSAGLSILRSGRDLIVPDVHTFSALSDAERARWLELDFKASVSIPLVKEGRLVATLAVRQTTPRDWTPYDVELVREVAERTRADVERARAEEALRESARALEETNRQKTDIFESIYDCFYALDKELRFVYVNKAAEEIWGLSRTDLIGHRIGDVFDGLIDISLSKFRQALEEQTPQHYEVYSKVIRRWGEMSVVPTRDGISVYFHDTTDRRRVEEVLRESEKKFRALVLASAAMTYSMSPDWRVMRQLSGLGFLANTESENINWISEYIPPEDQPIVTERINEAIRNKSNFELEHRVFRADGGLGWGHSTAIPFLDSDGEITEWFGAASDITVRKRADEERERLLSQVFDEQERLRAIINSIDDEVWVTDITGNMAQLNPSAQRAHGLQADGKPILENADSLEISESDGTLRLLDNTPLLRALKGEIVRGEEIVRHLNTGEVRYRRFNCAPIRDRLGNITGTVSISRDISDAKRAERDLKESEARIHTAIAAERQRLYDVLENLPAMVCLLTPDYHVAFANQAFREKFGESRGRHCYEYCMGIVDGPCVFCESFKVLETDKPHHWEAVASDGSVIDVYDHPFTDVDGSPLILEMDLDITERKRAEKALRESEQKAHALVAELEEADKNKNHFISILSHELRNPTAAIVAGLSYLESSADKAQNDKTLEIIRRQADQLTRLVDDLLELTRITENKIKLRTEQICLNETVSNAAHGIKLEYRQKGVHLWVKAPDQPVVVQADPVRIMQCIGNILNNALKFTGNSGDVWLTLEREDARAVIRVRDNGAGIGADLLGRIFEPFTQADESLDRSGGGGLGLGLTIVKGLIEMHGGSVSAFSEGLGRGSVFTLRLPVSSGVADPAPEAEIPEKPGRVHKILIIDDGRALAEIMRATFEAAGHKAYVAHDGLRGLGLAKKTRPDIVLCDIGLPGRSGYEVAVSIRNDAELKNTYLVAMTGYTSLADKDLARKKGFDSVLAKPVDMAVIDKILSALP
jgi:PAS domain S-box-containing protein